MTGYRVDLRKIKINKFLNNYLDGDAVCDKSLRTSYIVTSINFLYLLKCTRSKTTCNIGKLTWSKLVTLCIFKDEHQNRKCTTWISQLNLQYVTSLDDLAHIEYPCMLNNMYVHSKKWLVTFWNQHVFKLVTLCISKDESLCHYVIQTFHKGTRGCRSIPNEGMWTGASLPEFITFQRRFAITWTSTIQQGFWWTWNYYNEQEHKIKMIKHPHCHLFLPGTTKTQQNWSYTSSKVYIVVEDT
jgi:hypothetical protein